MMFGTSTKTKNEGNPLIRPLNENTNAYALMGELKEIKQLLSSINAGVGASQDNVDDMIVQLPDSAERMMLAAGETFTREIAVNKRLRSITVYADADVYITLENNGSQFLWFQNQAGNEQFFNGKYISTLRITATNIHATDAERWNMQLIFA